MRKGRWETPAGFFTAWERVFPFLDQLHQRARHDKHLTISEYLTALTPQLNFKRFMVAVKLLEKHYGVTLFNRATGRSGRNTLTEDGKLLLRQARAGFEHVQAMPGAAPLRVRIAAFGFSLGARLAGPVTRVLAHHSHQMAIDFRSYPDVRAALAALARRRVHCVFAAHSPMEAAGLENEVEFRPMAGEVRPVLLYSARGKKPEWDKLATYRWVIPAHLVAEWASLLPNPGGKGAQGWLRVPSFFEVLEFVRLNAGVALFPDLFAKDGADGLSPDGVKFIPWPDAPGIQFGVYVAKDFDQATPERVRSFLNEVFAALALPVRNVVDGRARKGQRTRREREEGGV